jgi:hypothetical protein
MAAPMSTPADLQAAGDYDQATPTSAGPEGSAPPLVVCIEVKPNGEIAVYDKAGTVDPQPAESLEDALQSAGELISELSTRMAASAMKDAQMARPGNADAQAMWDQMAAQREPRGNT